jgi:hypothetical protein
MRTFFEALAAVLLVSFLSLGFRTGSIVALTVPLVLAGTFLSMLFFGIDLHRISLGALILALGLLVDDAMIAIEMMARKLEEGWDRFRAATYAYSATAFPMLTGTLVTIAGFLPVGLAKSQAGFYLPGGRDITPAFVDRRGDLHAVLGVPHAQGSETRRSTPRSLRYPVLQPAAALGGLVRGPS